MVNIGFSWGSFIGIVLAVAGASLYFLRSVRPGLARDYDIFFAAVGLLCGGILFFNSWRLDPILQFSQFLLAGSTIFFAYESVRLRGVTTEQAKRSTPVVDDDRPVSRVYRAELDDDVEALDEEEDFYPRRIRGALGSRDPQLERSQEYRDDDYDESRSRRGGGDRPRSSRPAPSNRRPPQSPSRRSPGRRPTAEDDWGGDDAPPSRPPRSGPRPGRPPARRGPAPSESPGAGMGDRPRSRRGSLNLEPPPSESRPGSRSESRRPRGAEGRRSEGTLFDDQPYEPRSRRQGGPPSGRPSAPPPESFEERPDMPSMGREPRRAPPRDTSDESYVDYQPLDDPTADAGAEPP
ncbi:MAG: Ycf66 family protein [Cyanophyceae cyanobacterium]